MKEITHTVFSITLVVFIMYKHHSKDIFNIADKKPYLRLNKNLFFTLLSYIFGLNEYEDKM